MYLPVFLCFCKSFWKGFESDSETVNIAGIKCLFVWRVERDSYVSIKVDCLQSTFSLKIRLVLS